MTGLYILQIKWIKFSTNHYLFKFKPKLKLKCPLLVSHRQKKKKKITFNYSLYMKSEVMLNAYRIYNSY